MDSSVEKLASGIRELQIVVQVENELRRVCKFAFCNSDASTYLIPYAAGGEYYFGGQRLPEHRVSHSFSFAEQFSTTTAPKVSIHESGQVHIQVGGERVGPLLIRPVGELRGEHVASICVDRFDHLPLLSGPARTSGRKVDFVMRIPEGLHSGRFPLYLNGATPQFMCTDVVCCIRILRPSLRAPLYLGMAPRGQSPIADPAGKQGVTVICGWDLTNPTDFLYLRGQ